MKKIIIPLVLVLTIFSCKKEGDPHFVNNWDEDIYFFSKNLKDKHVDLFFNISKNEFDSDIKRLRDNALSFSDQEFLIGLTKIISKIGDSHTVIELGSMLNFLPFKVQWLSDGIILTEADVSHQAFLGEKVNGINGTPILTVLDSFRTVIPYENESNFKNQVVSYLPAIDFYNYFNFNNSTSEIEFNLANGSNIKIDAQSDNVVAISNSNVPLFLKNVDVIYWLEELTDDHLLYIQYNSCRERDDLSFQSFTNQIVGRLNNNPDIKKLVLDLRHNGGGNSAIAKPLIEEMQRLVSENRLDKSNIYIIIGRKTFSSALLNALEIKEKIDPVFIGEPTGGKPNHYGEVKNFRLPNSNLKVWYSTKYFEFSSNNEDSLEPDIYIDYYSDHLLNGIDPILEKIKE